MNNNIIRLMLIAGGIFAGCAALFYGGYKLYEGIAEREDTKQRLEREEVELIGRLALLERSRKTVDTWKAISMPGNLSSAGLKYKGFLQDLLLKQKVAIRSFSEPNRTTNQSNRQNTPVATHINFDIVFDATFTQLAAFLQDFYRVNVPHSIKNIVIEPQGKGSDAKLLVTLKVDALSMSNVTDRDSVVANPTSAMIHLEAIMTLKHMTSGIYFGLSQFTNTGLFGPSKLASKANPSREYETMQKKNIFAGLVSPQTNIAKDTSTPTKSADMSILKFTQLTSITANYVTEEALLRVRKTNKYVKLRAEGGINNFEIRDADNLLVLKGKVLTIKPRDLVFEYQGKAYALHVGQFVDEALKKELNADEMKAFDVVLTAVQREENTEEGKE